MPKNWVCFFVVPNTTTSVRHHTTSCVCVPNTVYRSLVRCYVANLPTYRTTTETTCVRENEDRGDISVARLFVIFEGQKKGPGTEPVSPPSPCFPFGVGEWFRHPRPFRPPWLCGVILEMEILVGRVESKTIASALSARKLAKSLYLAPQINFLFAIRIFAHETTFEF